MLSQIVGRFEKNFIEMDSPSLKSKGGLISESTIHQKRRCHFFLEIWATSTKLWNIYMGCMIDAIKNFSATFALNPGFNWMEINKHFLALKGLG